MDASRAKRLTLIACILGSSIVFVDQTVVNVALPALRADFHASLADQQWVVEAYLLLLASLVLAGGALGDLYGRRRIFALGVAGFGAASLVCALAPSIGVLIAARAPQGAFGALLVPSSLAIITADHDLPVMTSRRVGALSAPGRPAAAHGQRAARDGSRPAGFARLDARADYFGGVLPAGLVLGLGWR